ncbi:hypothetical protein E2F46_15215 [Luteimonas aestuarii]|uniref:Uncharacterized protein n=1 Tax=Luteimonas aestuarii TaxID=453837 RepID=A0A4R5TKV4_9GAMM|nr:hypothetical protein [Luteimonas aestuarii]TDK21047.1 hypothetical protein E2F46_15215 [Luteimonas aestuarii]
MAIVKLLAAGALGYLAYRTLQARQAKREALLDTGVRTSPHGDPLLDPELVGARIEVPPTPAAGAQSSRGFGAP